MPMEADGFTAGLAVDSEIFLNDQDTLKVGSEIQYYQLDDTWDSNPGSGMMTGSDFLNINNGKRNRFDVYGQIDSLMDRKLDYLYRCSLRYCANRCR